MYYFLMYLQYMAQRHHTALLSYIVGGIFFFFKKKNLCQWPGQTLHTEKKKKPCFLLLSRDKQMEGIMQNMMV